MRGVQQVEPVLGDGVVEAELALDGVVSLGVALEDDDLAALAEGLAEGVAGQLGAGAVVRAEEGQVDARVGHGLLVERDVDVDDLDAGLERPGDGLDHGLGVGRGDDDDVELLGDVVLDGADLGGEVTLVLHAHGLEVEDVGVLGRVRLGAGLHLLEELVGQALHDQADLGLVAELRRQVRQRPGRLDRRALRGAAEAAGAADSSWAIAAPLVTAASESAMRALMPTAHQRLMPACNHVVILLVPLREPCLVGMAHRRAQPFAAPFTSPVYVRRTGVKALIRRSSRSTRAGPASTWLLLCSGRPTAEARCRSRTSLHR